MARFVVSDHHFGHANIIDYCDRPFGTVGEMDATLVDRHYERVEPDDVVVHLGDVAMDMSDGSEAVERLASIGVDLLVAGNHDVGLDDGQAPIPVVDACRLSHDGRTFYCTHKPADVPDEWDGWVIHGHHHNRDLEAYPFFDARRRRINVGVDVTGFAPVELESLTTAIDRADATTRIPTVEHAESV